MRERAVVLLAIDPPDREGDELASRNAGGREHISDDEGKAPHGLCCVKGLFSYCGLRSLS
jgi:hypothetical protein